MSNQLSKEFFQSGVLFTIRYQLKDLYLSLNSVRQNTNIDKENWSELIQEFEQFQEKFNKLYKNRLNNLK